MKLKFRAWDKTAARMFSVARLGISPGSGVTDLTDGKASSHFERWTDELVIEQFTGLIGKDGNEIYEGDIVQVRCSGGWRDNKLITGQVFYNESHVCFEVRYDIRERMHGVEGLDAFYKVIGNIHENPELMETV